MDIHMATEMAYKNGYKRAKKDFGHPQIILTQLDDNYFQWVVIENNEIIGMGYEEDSFQAFKTARFTFDNI